MQGYKLTVRINPDLIPANGASGAVIEVRLRNLVDGTGVADKDVYVALYEVVTVDDVETKIPWTSEYFYLENGQSRMQTRTNAAGLGYVNAYTRDAFSDRGGWDLLYGVVYAEVNTEIDHTEYQFDSSDAFRVYNPYY